MIIKHPISTEKSVKLIQTENSVGYSEVSPMTTMRGSRNGVPRSDGRPRPAVRRRHATAATPPTTW